MNTKLLDYLLEVDLIIKNAYIATVNSSNQIIKNGSIVINDTKIVYVGLDSSKYKAKRTIDAVSYTHLRAHET